METQSNNIRSNAVLLLLIITIATNLVPSKAVSPVAVTSGEKVSLTLYYEALCPYCENFIVNYLYKIFENGLISIVDLKLSPYGNAKISSNGTIICQHGEWECILNTVEACAIHTWPAVGDYFPFVYCVEKLTYEGKYTEWETCFDKLNLDSKPVTDCISSGFGNETKQGKNRTLHNSPLKPQNSLSMHPPSSYISILPFYHTHSPSIHSNSLNLQYADEIKALEPPHTYVPWVTVNGQPIYDDYMDFISIICKAYKGSNVPQVCFDLTHSVTAPKDTANALNHVCYTEDNTMSKSTLSKIISSAATSWIYHVGLAESM
ncbi:thioredoxin superfamily protein [Artemisia annua]|uniref:Thioredoxin superfamily protein n=1 Tax=Artemisia annua TaxID=35608 RepID=A0A2U1MHN7_ARTAN|nr:thioredoxin superfamily protein [Artemisia annua]